MANELPMGKWRLVAFNFGVQKEITIKNSKTTLIVGRDGQIGGNTGCNAFGGEYTFEKGRFKIGDLISTMMACDEPTPDFEYKYFGLLRNATKFEAKKTTLTISDPKSHSRMRFSAITDASIPQEAINR